LGRLISAVKGAPNADNPIVQVVLCPPAALTRSIEPILRMQQDICVCWYHHDRIGMETLPQQLDRLIQKKRSAVDI